MAENKTYQISITTRVQFVPEQSDPLAARYVFAYTITIRNTGTVAAQLSQAQERMSLYLATTALRLVTGTLDAP